jgi:hypothetical protein
MESLFRAVSPKRPAPKLTRPSAPALPATYFHSEGIHHFASGTLKMPPHGFASIHPETVPDHPLKRSGVATAMQGECEL